MKALLSFAVIFLLIHFTKAQNAAPFETSQNLSLITEDSLLEEDLPEEQEEILSELDLLIIKEIGKLISFENRKDIIFSLIEEAKTYLGTPYVFGGTTRKGIDCSAFMQSIYSANEISLPRVSRNQALMGDKINFDDIEMGDMIFFSNSPKSNISHVGMVVEVTEDDIYFIHAGSSTGVTISPLSMNYWKKRFRFAKRVFGDTPEEVIAQS